MAEAAADEHFLDFVPCGIVACDVRGRIVRANAFFRRLCGISADEPLQSFNQYLTRPSRVILNAQVLPLLQRAGQVREATLDVQGVSSIVPVLLNGDFDGHGTYVFSLFPAADRRQHERELLLARKQLNQSRDYLELAEKLANVGHWHFDLATDKGFWSPEIYSIIGLDPDGPAPALNQSTTLYHPDDQASVAAGIEAAIRSGEGFSFAKRIIRPATGEIRHVVASGVCETDVHGTVIGLFGVFRDITDAVQNQADLAASESRYRLLADHSNDIITIFDVTGTISYISPAITKVLGYAPEEMVGKHVNEIVHPDDFASVQAAYRTYVLGGVWDDAPRIRYRALHKGGHYIWAEANPTVILGDDGRVASIQDVVRDISRQKATEDALARASVEANAAAEAKAQFLATMSHELRTPLTSIIGFSGLLRDLLTGQDDLRRHASRIQTAGQSLLGLINDILDHSKLEAGQLELDLAPADVGEIVAEAVDLLQIQAGAKGLSLEVNGAGDLPSPLLVDDGRLRQILVNLISNAVKFTASGGVTVAIAYDPDGSGRLRFSVRDTGPGISEAGQKALFQRFTQVDRATHDGSGGTGLGLSICRQLVELMHGAIGVNSVLGHGAEFWFDIPLPDTASVTEGTAEHTPGHLLVVDDQDAVAELLVNLLRRHGHVVDVAHNGYDAVEACRRSVYDLVLMDINMPVMDGFTASRAIRDSSPLNRDVPILALTAAGGSARQQACLASGMNALVLKPVNPSALSDTVALWLSSAPREAGMAAAMAGQTSARLVHESE
ncbi:PAS domain S-box protein [Asticcacaulis solisilvae]|uniref:PAS domain S-box protein n=1 Tax=Asticcacaulis solisilvae TaxID=1217274 RepID=UPI003FD8C7A5